VQPTKIPSCGFVPTLSHGWTARVVLSLLLFPFALVDVQAQSAGADGDQPEKKPSFWVEPRVSVEATYTDNSRLTGVNPESDLIASISPGVRAVFNTPRASGSVDYALSSYSYAQGTFGNGFQHTLNALSTVNLWDNHLFVDLLGVVDRVAISAFGPQIPGVPKNDNLSQSSNFAISPYFKGTFGGTTDYEIRYRWRSFGTSTNKRSDYDNQSLSARLASQRRAQLIGWAVDAKHETYDYTLGRKTKSDSLLGTVYFAPANDLDLSLFAGRDANDQLTLDRRTYTTSGASVDWRLSERTRFAASADRSYFGNGYNLSVEHKTARTIWRYVARRGVISNALEDAVPFGYNYGLYDELFKAIEPDPVKRAQLVEAELAKLGLGSPADVYRAYLASSATLEQTQQASLLLLGIRSVTTLTVSRGSSRRLDTLVGAIGDDFDLNSTINQQLWSLDYAYRLTPLTSVNASVGKRKFESVNRNLRTSVTSLTLGMTARLGLRTTGSIQLSHSKSKDQVDPYSASSVFAAITHRF
jgi:uncharacterized protein (PEP-CTERM system associated)